jgi:hypothetical protein
MVMTCSNASYLASVQALTLNNCTLTGSAYTNDVLDTDPVTGMNLTSRTTLPANTTMLVLTATKVNNALPVAVNALVIDTCGRGKSFDPVLTTLEVKSGSLVRQRFDGIPMASAPVRSR